jgi:hypothetical protein
VEVLLATFQPTRNKTEAQAQKHVRQDGTQYGGTDDGDIRVCVARLEQHHEEHKFDNGAKGGFDQDTENLGDLAGELGTSEADHVGSRDHGDIVGDEDSKMPLWARKMLYKSDAVWHNLKACTHQGNGHGHNGP